MVPVAIEGCAPGAEGGGPRGSSISLAMLIDFIVQRTYHELTVLAELLPRKTDMERKIEIYKFSARTRQLFVRLLALVKWASSASKVDRSTQIMGFLDKQALLFVETADVLARVARETLVHARLPTFHMAAAVEVLTLGTYSRLPAIIRERLVPPSPLTAIERMSTLRSLAHVVRQRLTTAALPCDVRNLKVDNGRATFTVGHEFSVAITVMGDSPNLPWRLLDIAILIQDNETGEGKPLVHPSQLSWLRGVAQARLGAGGLAAALTALRFFCRALALELLYTQTLRLCRDRLARHLQVDRYTPGQRLQVSYWRELGCELGYRLCVEADNSGDGMAGGLRVTHVPALAVGAVERVRAALSPHAPSMERLLAHAVHARSRARLADLKTMLAGMGIESSLGGSPCVLSCSLLSPCQRAEQLLVGVGAHGGALRCRVPQHTSAPHMHDLASAFAQPDQNKIKRLLSELRYWLVARRCEKTLQHLPASVVERLPFLGLPPDHALTKLAPHRLYVTLHRHVNHIIVIEMKEVITPPSLAGASTLPPNASTHSVSLTFHLAGVKMVSADECEGDPTSTSINTTEDTSGPTPNVPKPFMCVHTIVELDTFAMTHGPFTPLDSVGGCGKRKLSAGAGPGAGGTSPGRAVRARQPAYFLPELSHVVAATDERVPFVNLGEELASRGFEHGGLQLEPPGASPSLQLVRFPTPAGADELAMSALRRRTLSATIRIALRHQTRVWTAEIAFHSSPIQTTNPKEQSARRCVYLQYDMLAESGDAERMAQSFVADWSSMVHLHALVHTFMQRPQSERDQLSPGVVVRSYTYRTLTLGCGPGGRATCTVEWRKGRYHLTLGAQQGAANAHALIRHQLEEHLNWFKDLLWLGVVLRETYAPLVALSRLPTAPQLGLQHARPQVPVPTFTLIPHSWRKIRVAYAGAYCVEVSVRGGGLVAVRDGSFSRFDHSVVVGDEFSPTQGLKSFLSRYAEDAVVARAGAGLLSEDDNPPSPTSPAPTPGGSGLRFSAPMTPPMGPHTPHSQPLTPHPASPAQHQHGNFNLTSPGGLAHASPASPLLPAASPLAAASPHAPPGSPFAAWPASPSLPRTSPAAARVADHKGSVAGRVLVGGRAWAGATPTILTSAALDALCSPCEPPPGAPPGPTLAPLERFLGCIYMRRHLHRFIQQEEPLSLMVSSETGAVVFRAEGAGLQGRVALHPQHMQSLHLQLSTLPDHKDAWSPDDLQVMEKFFETRVTAAPYRPTALWGWGRVLGAPGAALRDLVALMRAELAPPPGPAAPRWQLQWALRIPPAAPQIVPNVQPAVLLARNKILFFLTLTRGETQLVVPLVYDVSTNLTQLAEKRDTALHSPPPHMLAVNQHLKRFSEFNNAHGECSLWPAVRDLVTGLVLPESPAPSVSQPPS